MNQFLEKFVISKFKRPGVAMDFGCGKGYDVACMNSLGWEVEGFDLPEDDLNKPFKRVVQLDLIYSNFVLPFIYKKEIFVDSIYNNLKNKGWVFLIIFSKEDKEFSKKGGTKEELTELFGKFEHVEIEEHDFYDNEDDHKHWHKLLVLTGQKKDGG